MRKFIGLFLLLASCAREGGGGDTKFLIPWRTSDGHYKLQEVTISTLASPFELRGEAAEVFYQTGFSEEGFQGSIARPRLIKSGDVYIPMDAESSIAVSVYAQFDHLFKYEAKLGTRGQVSWPRKVGVELNMVGPDGSSVNNAHYFTSLDVIGIVPYDLAGVPVSMNHGIVAHEHFHAHFQAQVMNQLNRIPYERNPTPNVMNPNILNPIFNMADALISKDDMDQRTPRGLNNLILRAWNEGLADLFAALYVGEADFFGHSVPGIGEARELSADSGMLLDSLSLLRISQTVNMERGHKMAIAYEQGTVLARMLYKLAKSGVNNTPEKFLSRFMSNLPKLPTALSENLNREVFDFEMIVPVLLEDYTPDAESCRALRAALSPKMMKRSFAQCSAL